MKICRETLTRPSGTLSHRMGKGRGEGCSRLSTFDSRLSSAFTLIEVMIAGMILFMCLFAILALVANGLRNARALQATRSDPRSSIAAELYYQLSRTNSIAEDSISGEFEGHRYEATTSLYRTNGLWLVELAVAPERHAISPTLTLQFLVFNAAGTQQGVPVRRP